MTFEELVEYVQRLEEKIEDLEASLRNSIDGVESELGRRIGNVEDDVDGLRRDVDHLERDR